MRAVGGCVTAVLVAAFVFGFFAAGLLSVFWLLAVSGPAALAAIVISALQGTALWPAIGLGAAFFALVQVGFALGLFRAAAQARHYVPD